MPRASGLPSPNLEQRIPRTGAQADAVVANTETADTVLVATKRADFVATKRIPNFAFEVVVASKEQASRNGEGNRSDSAENLLVLIRHELAIGANVKQSTGSIVGTCAKGIAIREELNSVDIRLMAGERLNSFASANVPKLSKGIARARDKDVGIGGIDADAHDIAKMIGELGNLGAGLNIPHHAGHIAGRSDDFAVVDEATAGEIARVA